MPTIYIENKPYEVKAGQNLLHACLSLGFNIPYFCWHPALGSVGACRQCAVKQFKDEHDTRGRIVMSCMTPVADGMRISIDDEEVRAFRASVIDWLMTNHPHDCPICDEGGECHLQDMTVMTGHAYRTYRFTKRTYSNQNLGPFINHEMNRCIQCYRCARFYCDYAGGRDFGPFAAHNHVYFGRHEDGALENEFSGNLVEVCPTGVFTDKSFKQHYTRPWDLQTAPSVCVHCGLGCNITPGERYGGLRRIRNRYNGAVNGYFLCDRGRYGYEFVNGDRRIRQPLLRASQSGTELAPRLEPVSKEEAIAHLAQIIGSIPDSAALDSAFRIPHSAILGIGSPRASLESNFALRTLVGPDRFFMGLAEHDRGLVATQIDLLRDGPARTPSLSEIGEADAVFVLGEDVTNVAPLIALRLRQAVRVAPLAAIEKTGIPAWNDAPAREALQDARGPLFLATPCDTKLDDIARAVYHAAPDDLAGLGFAVAHAVDPQAPAPGELSEDVQRLAADIARALQSAQRPLIVSGPSCGSEAILHAAANVAQALCHPDRPAMLCFTTPECNTIGLGLMGGGSLEDAFKRVADGNADTVIILENDLYRRADRAAVDAMLAAAKHIIVIDHTEHETSRKAGVVLPAAAFSEGDGTLVNNEGRAQRFVQVYRPEGEIRESWRWIGKILTARDGAESPRWSDLDAILMDLERALQQFRGISKIAPAADARFAGQRLPRQPHRYSGRTAMNAQIRVSEPKLAEDPDSPFAFSMEGYRGSVPSAVIPSFWAPGWNSVQGLNKFQDEVGGPLRGGDPGLRLIDHAGAASFRHAENPGALQQREGECLVVPLYHIFGSEELSVAAGPIIERAPRPYLALNPTDAARLSVTQDQCVELRLDGAVYRLPVALRSGLPTGVAGVPVGLAEVAYVRLPAWGVVAKGTPA